MKKKTKKYALWTTGALIILIGLFLIWNFSIKDNLFEKKIHKIVVDEASKYCNYLDEKAIYNHCESCRGGQNYVLVEDFSKGSNLSQSEYTINQNNGEHIVNVQMNTIFGFNTRTGSEGFSFAIKKDGRVVSPTYPENTCLN